MLPSLVNGVGERAWGESGKGSSECNGVAIFSTARSQLGKGQRSY